MDRINRVSKEGIVRFTEYLTERCVKGDMRLGQALLNFTTWYEARNGHDFYNLEEKAMLEALDKFNNQFKIEN